MCIRDRILYCYNFSDVEAYILKDYERYIGPYYQGWMQAMLCLLGRSAANCAGRWYRLADGALLGAAACVMAVFFWRGVPTAGFWSNADSLDLLRQDCLLYTSRGV